MRSLIKKICFTGGGSSGHVTPNIAIMQQLEKSAIERFYIGSYNGIEKELIKKESIEYFSISSGKLRRYFSWENFIDPFKIIKGIFQSYLILKKKKPQMVFCKGGFVTFPVAVAAKLNKIPVIVHESDLVPGLANKLIFPLATKICITFAATKINTKYQHKTILTGSPIRKGFFSGDKNKALETYKLDSNKKTILVMGGGLGSVLINHIVIECLPIMLQQFNIIHLTGKGKLNSAIQYQNYFQVEYLHDEIYDAMALADLVISRAGSNSLYELIMLKKKHILIPLSKQASRGDQIDNAKFFEKQKLSYMIQEELLSPSLLLTTIKDLYQDVAAYEERLAHYQCPNGTIEITKILTEYFRRE